jgi:hypothetical protein
LASVVLIHEKRMYPFEHEGASPPSINPDIYRPAPAPPFHRPGESAGGLCRHFCTTAPSNCDVASVSASCGAASGAPGTRNAQGSLRATYVPVAASGRIGIIRTAAYPICWPHHCRRGFLRHRCRS